MKKLLTLISMVVLVAIAAVASMGAFEKTSDQTNRQVSFNQSRNATLFDKYGGVQVTPKARRASSVDEYGIIQEPDEGETKYYTYNALDITYNNEEGAYTTVEKTGIATVVYAEDGTVYMNNVIPSYNTSAWIKGSVVNNTLVFPIAQPLGYNSKYDCTLSLFWGEWEKLNKAGDQSAIIFEVVDDNLVMQKPSGELFLGVFWDDDNSWTGCAIDGMTLTINNEYTPPSTELVVLPESAEVQEWYAVGVGTQAVPETVKVTFVDNDIYIGDLSGLFPDTWIKGTIDGSTVTFPSYQYVGDMYDYHIWAMGFGYDSAPQPTFTMTYDAEAGILTFDENQLLAFNADENRLFYLTYYWNLIITKDASIVNIFNNLRAAISEAEEVLANTFLTYDGQNLLNDAISAAYAALYSGDTTAMSDNIQNLKTVQEQVLATETITVTSWTLAGSSEIFGSYWDPADTSNDMTEVDDGVFELIKHSVYLEGDRSYEFKVVGNHAWDVNFGADGMRNGQNVYMYIEESGNYDITFYFYTNDNYKLDFICSKLNEPAVWTIAGSSAEIFGTVWDPTNTDNDMTEDKDGYFVLNKNNVTLVAGVDYEFKVVADHSWDLNYGADGEQGGYNVVFSVDKDGKYNLQFYFERNAGNKLYCVYNYASGGGFDPGNLKMVYSIDYAGYNGFPFYVMGYVPEWVGGVMTDYGAGFGYKTDDEMADFTGGTEVGIVTTAGGATYHKVQLDEPAWHQYFIADGIPTELDESYIVKAKVRASEDCAINVNMGWGWGEGQIASATVYIGTKWQEVEWEYTGIGGTSCNLIARPGSFEGTIEWASLAVYKKVNGEQPPAEWIEYITNGDAEKSWEDMGYANISYNDTDNNFKVCAWSKEKGHNMDEYDAWNPFPANIEADPTDEKNLVFVVHGEPATTEGDASAWDNQFWIQSPQAWKAGTQLRIKFRYRCNYPAGVTTNTQIHKQSPGDYLIWHAIGDITFTEEWQEFDGIMTMGDDMAGGWSIAFNLNSEVKDAVDFYFDDLSWQAMKLDEGFFVAGCNTTTGLEYDFYNANEFTWDDNQGLYVATIGTRGKKETYVDQIMISTVRGDNQSFKANTIRPNGQINNDPEEWLDYTQQSNAKINLPGAGVWRIYIDYEYNAMAFQMIEGEYKPPIEINPNPTMVIAHALEREYTESEAEAAGIEKPEYPGQPWDNQFYICANRPLSAGEETIVEFQYKATRPASASTQCHAEPGAYLHWSAIGGLYFEEDWQTFSTVFTVPQEADGMSTITFNLAEIKEANDYYFKDVVWKLSDNTESLINQEGPENFFWKAVGGNVTPCEAESEILNVPQALDIISTLAEGEYTNEYYKVKGIVTEIKEISTTYGNATFYIKSPDVSDETLYVYRAYGFNGEKITDEHLFTVGDEVVLYSQLQNYRGIPETRQGGYLLSISHNVTPADVLAQLTSQIAATEAAIDSLTYGNIPGVTELLQLVAEAKTATEESGIEVLYGYINDLQAYTSYVVSLDEEYKWLEALMNRIELVIQNNPNANPDLVVEATNKIQEVRTAMTNGAYTSNTIWDAVNMMNDYYNELSKVYLTINVEEPGTLRAILEEMGFEPSSVIGLTISGSLDYNDFNVLNEMYNIEHLDMGETNITELWGYMFSGRPLKSVVLPKNLQRLNNYTFAWCNNLTEIELPASLQSIEYNVFYGCEKLKSITYNSVIPLELYDQLMDWDYAHQCTLYVPAIVASLYESSSYWNWFKIEGTDIIPEEIIVNRAIALDWPEGIGTAFKPNVTLTNSVNNNNQYGKLTINGTSTISMNSFNMLWDPYRCRWSDTYNDETGSWEWYRHSYSALVANAPMRADNVGITLNTTTYRWDFLTFPFDVKVGDIVNLTQTNAPLVIRRYDGKNRADGKMGETWINMTADMTLEAGKGYIWQSAEGDQYSDNNNYSVPALDNAKKNNIFANNDVTVELNEYLSEFSQNRSWNLIGNPYPAFYDIRGMQTTAPITVWNGYNGVYEAYTPGDDNYILNPGQAFFIQRPLDQESITFLKEGRQIDLYRRDAADFEGGTRAAATQERFVFNLTLTGSEEKQGDRTRIVFNADAKTNYEAGRDASKFMSLQDAAVQLFTTSDGVNYAINERPAMDGIVELGMNIGVAGNYTFALNTTVENEVYLIDRETGNETRIDGGSTYTFYANKGNFEGRFALRFGNGEVTGIKAIASDSNNADNWYNLKGQRVNAPTKGLYIQNGKKTVVK